MFLDIKLSMFSLKNRFSARNLIVLNRSYGKNSIHSRVFLYLLLFSEHRTIFFFFIVQKIRQSVNEVKNTKWEMKMKPRGERKNRNEKKNTELGNIMQLYPFFFLIILLNVIFRFSHDVNKKFMSFSQFLFTFPVIR